jgi:hypothetical protein
VGTGRRPRRRRALSLLSPAAAGAEGAAGASAGAGVAAGAAGRGSSGSGHCSATLLVLEHRSASNKTASRNNQAKGVGGGAVGKAAAQLQSEKVDGRSHQGLARQRGRACQVFLALS